MIKYNTAELLDLTIRAARYCAFEIENCINPTLLGCKASSTDLISLADGLGEAAIKSLILSERPQDGLMGEEGSCNISKTGLRWVFDPLDGTVNYLYKIPHWAISIACERLNGEHWQPIVGVVYDVIRDETFTSVYGEGAYMNGTKISINKINDLANALLATEFSYHANSCISQAQLLVDILPQIRGIRSSGSSALDLCWVANGRLDGFYENELHRWDWSASSLIVEEAGGKVSPWGTGVIAGSPALHSKLYNLCVGTTKK